MWQPNKPYFYKIGRMNEYVIFIRKILNYRYYIFFLLHLQVLYSVFADVQNGRAGVVYKITFIYSNTRVQQVNILQIYFVFVKQLFVNVVSKPFYYPRIFSVFVKPSVKYIYVFLDAECNTYLCILEVREKGRHHHEQCKSVHKIYNDVTMHSE